VSEVLHEKVGILLKKNFLFVLLIVFLLGGVADHFLVKKDRSCVCDIVDTRSENSVENNGRLRVDVSGAVKDPGVYEVDDGAVVGDVLSLAGGAKNEASASWVSRYLNLSDRVKDSEKIYIPFEWEFYFPEKYSIVKTINKSYAKNDLADTDSVVKDVDNSSDKNGSDNKKEETKENTSDTNTTLTDGDSKINVNTASSSELDSLPGIGPAYAEKIISNRPYKDISEFEEISGLYKSNIDKIKDLITF
jgi:competence protein ComEA